MEFPNKKYQIIYADPPWNESGGGKIKRGADRHYSLMKTRDICLLPVKYITNEDCHLYLWSTNSFLQDAFKVIEAWGFRYITTITWTKDRFGLGQYFRGMTEHCLFAVKGKGYNLRQGQGVTSIQARRREHSKKPDEMRKMIEKVSCGNKIELFAREKAEGWDSWGNELPEKEE